jgi:GNAT superfamily N-acetyltransferase
MKTRIFRKDESILKLKDVTESWLNECNVNDFGIRFNLGSFYDDLHKLVNGCTSDLLILETDDGEIAGIMGLTFFKSPLGVQYMANEHYWYILPQYRGNGLKLIAMAREWAKKMKCNHLILNASMMASDVHDKVCGIYERIGMKKFETTYIERVGD